MLELLLPVNQVQLSLQKRELDSEVTLYHITATHNWVKWLVTGTMLVRVITVMCEMCDNDVCSSSSQKLVDITMWVTELSWLTKSTLIPPSSLTYIKTKYFRLCALRVHVFLCTLFQTNRLTDAQTLTLISCPSHARRCYLLYPIRFKPHEIFQYTPWGQCKTI